MPLSQPAPNQPILSVLAKPARDLDWLILGLDDDGIVGLDATRSRTFKKTYGQTVDALAADLGARTDRGRTTGLPSLDGCRLLVVGLGTEDPTPEQLRRLSGDAIRAVGGLRAEQAEPARIGFSLGVSEPEQVLAVAEGALTGGYCYTGVSAKDAPTAPVAEIAVITSLRDTSLARVAQARATAIVAAREWINIPPNLLYPETFAQAAKDYLAKTKVKVEVLDDDELAKLGYGGLSGVGAGSARKPRLVRMSYRPRGAKQHLALIGKGITFDSGGLNLKPGNSMLTMKSDMSGAAAVIAAVGAIAECGITTDVTAYAALAENLPSSTAYRPSDVLSIYGGTTVENMNSDAEGRLVMADALARSVEDKPDLIVDIATLTGACLVALGLRTAGLLSSDEETSQRVLDAAETSGESFWPLPIPEEVAEDLESKVADLRSTGGSRYAGTSAAAAFLQRFVPDQNWAHLDIAGPAFHDGSPYGYVTPGGTGFGVRTLIDLAQSMS